MIYLLVNHVALGRTDKPGEYAVNDLWLEDLAAQARAITAAGMRLVVATPCVDDLSRTSAGGFNTIRIRPPEHGFSYEPLPRYQSLAGFLSVRRQLRGRLREITATAGIVQMGYGGHPVPLGSVVWPIAGALGRPRIWVFDGADPFPRMQLRADHEPNPIKRWAKRRGVVRFAAFCRTALREADLVFAHNAAVVERFRDAWDARRCHAFDRTFVSDTSLLSQSELNSRLDGLRDASRPLKLVVAGRQIAIKGTDHVLRALAAARSRGASLELDVWGDGEDLPEFRHLAHTLGLDQPIVRFRGTVAYGKPLFDAWSESHVMVITNLTAEISRNVLLGLARGLPLIMYRNPGTDRLVESANAGLLAPTSDVDALADAMVRAASDREALAGCAQRGWALACGNTLDACHRRRAELARSVIESRQAAGTEAS
jgi:glycosyltransferase involved in cell wall biosynthesis